MPVFESREILSSRLQNIIGERTDDDALNFIQDALDTFDHHTSHSSADTITKAEHDKLMEEQDNNWRKRYRDTFFGTPDESFAGGKKTSKEDPADGQAGMTKDNPASFDVLFG